MYELYVLLSEESLARVAPLLSDDRSFLEELYLALATEPVVEIPEDALELLRENVALWRRGYAVPLRALEEVEHLTGEELELEFVAMLSSEELEAEPDASY
ncbi:MAG: hypothetical protein GXO66_04320, partial [Euryarchaeota archaeon]|nr:hypothetical protein [Euryarchaeota archaeon]